MSNQNAIYSSVQKNSKSQRIIDIFMPSMLGVVTYISIFVITLVVGQPSQIKTALQGFNIREFNDTFAGGFSRMLSKLFNSQIFNEIAIYVFWVIVAFTIYIIASRLIKNVDELADDYSLRHYIWPKNKNKNQPLKEFGEKLLFHFITLIILIFYLFKAIPFLSSLWKRTNFTLTLSFRSVITIICLFIIETLFLHIIVILIRLFLTRRRIVQL